MIRRRDVLESTILLFFRLGRLTVCTLMRKNPHGNTIKFKRVNLCKQIQLKLI